MNNIVPIPEAKAYWNYIKDTSDEVKKNLVALISFSLKSDMKRKEKDLLDKMSAPWPDDNLSADEFVDICESERDGNRELIDI